MATFRPYTGDSDNNQFIEPCMSCFSSVAYTREEGQDDPRVTGGKCIICPNCGKVMSVHFCNSCLC